MNVEYEMCDYISNNWGHQNSNTSLKKTFEDIHQIHYKRQLCWAHRTQYREYCGPQLGSLSSGDHHWFKRSTKKKRPVTRDGDNDNNDNKVAVTFLKIQQINIKINFFIVEVSIVLIQYHAK